MLILVPVEDVFGQDAVDLHDRQCAGHLDASVLDDDIAAIRAGAILDLGHKLLEGARVIVRAWNADRLFGEVILAIQQRPAGLEDPALPRQEFFQRLGVIRIGARIIVMVADVVHVGAVRERILRNDIDVRAIKFRTLGFRQERALVAIFRFDLAFAENHVGGDKAAGVGTAEEHGIFLHVRVAITRAEHAVAELVAEIVGAEGAEAPVGPVGNDRQGQQRSAGEVGDNARQAGPDAEHERVGQRDAVANQHGVEAMGWREELDGDFLFLAIELRVDDQDQAEAGGEEGGPDKDGPGAAGLVEIEPEADDEDKERGQGKAPDEQRGGEFRGKLEKDRAEDDHADHGQGQRCEPGVADPVVCLRALHKVFEKPVGRDQQRDETEAGERQRILADQAADKDPELDVEDIAEGICALQLFILAARDGVEKAFLGRSKAPVHGRIGRRGERHVKIECAAGNKEQGIDQRVAGVDPAIVAAHDEQRDAGEGEHDDFRDAEFAGERGLGALQPGKEGKDGCEAQQDRDGQIAEGRERAHEQRERAFARASQLCAFAFIKVLVKAQCESADHQCARHHGDGLVVGHAQTIGQQGCVDETFALGAHHPGKEKAGDQDEGKGIEHAHFRDAGPEPDTAVKAEEQRGAGADAECEPVVDAGVDSFGPGQRFEQNARAARHHQRHDAHGQRTGEGRHRADTPCRVTEGHDRVAPDVAEKGPEGVAGRMGNAKGEGAGDQFARVLQRHFGGHVFKKDKP